MKPWKQKNFRPIIMDSNFLLRERYHRALKQSKLSKAAFNRKMGEFGIEIMEKMYCNESIQQRKECEAK